MFFAPWTTLGFIELDLRCRVDRARATGDRGASVMEWVIITGILVALAAVVGGVIFTTIKQNAESITIPDAPGGGGGGAPAGGGDGNP